MKLVSFHVQTYRNFVDSTPVEADAEVTCLVGKNESGKTALLQALHNLNPANASPELNLTNDYPRWLKKEHELDGSIARIPPISATFALDEADLEDITSAFGADTVKSNQITVSKTYAGGRTWHDATDEGAFVRHFVEALDRDEVHAAVRSSKSIKDIVTGTERVVAKAQPHGEIEGNSALVQRAEKVRADLLDVVPDGDLPTAVGTFLVDRLPRFFYFGEYDMLPGRAEMGKLLDALKSEDMSSLDEGDATAVSLLRLASADAGNLTADFEVTIAELEAVANLLTKRVREYWHQNRYLRLEIAIEPEYGPNPHGGRQQVLEREWLQLRVNDTRHDYTNNLDRRSTGFRWFTSFFAAFFEFEADDDVIVLLDEPGLHLHGSAQKDLLRFVDERLTGRRQVLYTTHSPWMVPNDLTRVRIVEDAEGDDARGAVVTDQAATRDADTLFPLQAALGYDIAQNLFIGPDNLAVEGVSDFLYLTLVSDHLAGLARSHLDARWRVLPCGSADNIPAFVNLIGPHLQVSVLLDSGGKPNQRVDNLANRGLLDKRRIVTIGGIVGREAADIEDLFTDAEYVELFNMTFPDEKLKVSDLKGGDRLVARIERKLGHPFTHGRVAETFLREHESAMLKLCDVTLARFETLFEQLNATLTPT